MSTYLVAFIVVINYERVSNTTSSGIEVSVWAPAELIEQAHLGLSVATKVLDYYEEFFQQEYPLKKQGGFLSLY